MHDDLTDDPDGPDNETQRTARDRHAAMHRIIRERISLLDYPPGMRLSEAELAEEFGTSRTPLRRVLARLEDEGLVKSVHGVGTLVTDSDIHELEQVYRLRLELAELAGRLDPRPPDAAFMARLDALIQRSRGMIENGTPRNFTQLDMDVFRLLTELVGNQPLRSTIERFYFQTKRIWLKSALAAELDLREEFIMFQRELEDIRNALLVNDLEAVVLVQRAHISMSFHRLLAQHG